MTDSIYTTKKEETQRSGESASMPLLDLRTQDDYVYAINNIDTINGLKDLLAEYRSSLGVIERRRQLISEKMLRLTEELNIINREHPCCADIEHMIILQMGKLCDAT